MNERITKLSLWAPLALDLSISFLQFFLEFLFGAVSSGILRSSVCPGFVHFDLNDLFENPVHRCSSGGKVAFEAGELLYVIAETVR